MHHKQKSDSIIAWHIFFFELVAEIDFTPGTAAISLKRETAKKYSVLY